MEEVEELGLVDLVMEEEVEMEEVEELGLVNLVTEE